MNISLQFSKSIVAIVFVVFFCIPTISDAAWYNSNYQYCRVLTTTAGGGSGGVATTTTAGFALVATSTISTLAATSSAGHIFEVSTASGTTTPVDVAVTAGSSCTGAGTLLDFYFEKYVQTTGEFVLWVEPTDISSTTAKTVLLYYGYPDNTATDLSDEAGVFGASGEVGVWDLSENPAGTSPQMKDSLGVLDGFTVGTMTAGDSVNGYLGAGLDFDGSNDGVQIADHASLDVTRLSTSVWVKKKASLGYWGILFGRQRGSSSADLWVAPFYHDETNDGMSALVHTTSDQQTTPRPNTTLEHNIWVHYMSTYDGANIKLYRNGVLYGSVAQTGDIPAESTALCIGIGANGPSKNCSTETSSEPVNAVTDDVRFYGRGLHAMDVLTIYNNTVNSATFWTFGGEVEYAAVGGAAKKIRLAGVRLRGVRLR